MKITRVETITCSTYRDATWVQLHTDDGLVGLGETWLWQDRVAPYIHEFIAPYLLGQDPQHIERHHRAIRNRLELRRITAEVNALSAVDIALWDLFGQTVGSPIYQLLGGPVRDRVRVYNTCHGTTHPFHWQPALEPPDPNDYSARWVRRTPYYYDEVMWRQQGRVAELAQSMVEIGITAMKIWPFDPHRIGTDGQHITQAQINEAMKPFREIRNAVGMQLDLPVELHGGWYMQAAVRIAEALAEIRPMWIEDPLRSRDNIGAFAEIAAKTPIPVAISESFSGREIFREALENRAAGILNLDVCLVGGITEAHFIAQMAQTYDRPFALHAPVGPVNFTASSHVEMAEPNAMIQEGVRASYLGGWYADVLTELPKFERGYISAPTGPGLGTRLRPDFLARPDVAVQVSSL